MRKTKIICTLGPATDDPVILKQLFQAGMNVARLNFSHGCQEEHLKRINAFKKIRKEMNLPVALLLDTRGPEVRIKEFETGKITLAKGDIFTLTTDDIIGDNHKVSVTFREFPKAIQLNNRILIDDGLIEMKVLSKTETEVECKVLNGGEISNRKSVNVPDANLDIPYLNQKDIDDILFGIEHDFDFIAASFIRNENDVKEIRRILKKNQSQDIKIISKIENREGVNNINEILQLSDAIMIARGDMGVEIPFEELPAIQKKLIKKCYLQAKPVITATQLLDSMIRNPRPTRAEITDVANAIYDGTSALMLSGETSIGKYPVETILTMDKIARKTESKINYKRRFENLYEYNNNNITNAIGNATCSIAHNLKAAAIVTVTNSGNTARKISKYRPQSPIIGVSPNEKVINQLAISWGVYPVLSQQKHTTDEIFDQAISRAGKTGLIKNGDLVILTGGMPIGVDGSTNTIKVHIFGNVLLKAEGQNKLKSFGTACIVDHNDGSYKDFNAGDVLVIKEGNDQILQLIKNAKAVITEESFDSKSVIVAKALEIPVISHAIGATSIIRGGSFITVDANKGYVYTGIHEKEI